MRLLVLMRLNELKREYGGTQWRASSPRSLRRESIKKLAETPGEKAREHSRRSRRSIVAAAGEANIRRCRRRQ